MKSIAGTTCAILLSLALRAQQSGPLNDALNDLRRGDFAAAEQKLRIAVEAHPDDAITLSMLGAALDSEHKPAEADPYHKRAAELAPHSIDVLNNYAAHLTLSGREAEAAATYRRVLAIDPAHPGANLQLAAFAIKSGKASEALAFLDRLPDGGRSDPRAQLIRLAACYATGDTAQGDKTASSLETTAAEDPNLAAQAAGILADAHRYALAERFFEIALKASPTQFALLYNLGVVAGAAGDYERAREVLEAALSRQPENVDALYALAAAHEAAHHAEAAVQLLARASSLAPRRPDIRKLLAVTTAELGALDDSAAAWDTYLKLVPNDDGAKRERAWLDARMGRFAEAAVVLRRYVDQHPEDPLGHYELGQSERSSDPDAAVAEFDRALALDRNLASAYTARGSLRYQQGSAEAAVSDLEKAVALEPDDAAGLDRLGQVYQELDRSADALRVLRRAADRAPDDSKILLHLARALANAGLTDESHAAMDRFRKMGPEKKKGVPAGFVDYLSLSPEQRRAGYRARVEKTVREHPDDAAAQLAWLKLLLEDRNRDDAAALAQTLAAKNPPPGVLAEAGRAFLAADNFDIAADLLDRAGAASDLKIARARAACLRDSSASAFSQVTAAYREAISADPLRADLIAQAIAFMAKNNQPGIALSILEPALAGRPNDRELVLKSAALLARAGRAQDASKALTDIQNRWPEWGRGWFAQGVILAAQGEKRRSDAAFEMAAALGEPLSPSRDIESLLEQRW